MRRLKTATILLLCFSACLLIRPIRSWLDRAAVAIWIDRDVQIDSIRWHPHKSVLEVRDLSWPQTVKGREFEIKAEKVVLAVDPLTLADYRFRFPIVDLESFEIDYMPPSKKPPSSTWEMEMALPTWNDVSSLFDSLVIADELRQDWLSRIDGWISKSQKLAESSQRIVDDVVRSVNPLRGEGDLRNRLEQLAECSRLQLELTRQFEGLEKLMAAESSRLNDKHAQENELLRSHVQDTIEAKRREFLEHVIDCGLQDVWQSKLVWLDLADSVAVALQPADLPTYDVDMRRVRPEIAILGFPDISASGKLFIADQSFPLEVQGNYSLYTSGAKRSCTSEWQMDCETASSRLKLEVVCNGEENRIQLEELALQAIEPEAGQSHRLLQTHVVAAQNGLSGVISIGPAGMYRVLSEGQLDKSQPLGVNWRDLIQSASEEAMHLSQGSPANSDLQNIQARILGTWRKPGFELCGPIPEWLESVVDRCLSEAIRDTNELLGQKLETEYSNRLQRLQEEAILAAANAKRSCSDAQGLVQVQSKRIELALTEVAEDQVFARQPSDGNHF